MLNENPLVGDLRSARAWSVILASLLPLGFACWVFIGPIGIALVGGLAILIIGAGPLIAFIAGQLSVLILLPEPDVLSIGTIELALFWLLVATPALSEEHRPFPLPFVVSVSALLGIAVVTWQLYPKFWFVSLAVGSMGLLGSYGVHRLELVQLGLVE